MRTAAPAVGEVTSAQHAALNIIGFFNTGCPVHQQSSVYPPHQIVNVGLRSAATAICTVFNAQGPVGVERPGACCENKFAAECREGKWVKELPTYMRSAGGSRQIDEYSLIRSTEQ